MVADAAARRGVADRVLAALPAPEPTEGAHGPLGEPARLAGSGP
jgi:hypothetical protein